MYEYNRCRYFIGIMAERVGFDPLNAEPCTALHGFVRTQKTKHLSGFQLQPSLIHLF